MSGKKLTFHIRQNCTAPVRFLPEPDFCQIWKKCQIPAGAGAEIRYSPSKEQDMALTVNRCWFLIYAPSLCMTTTTNSGWLMSSLLLLWSATQPTRFSHHWGHSATATQTYHSI